MVILRSNERKMKAEDLERRERAGNWRGGPLARKVLVFAPFINLVL